MSLYYQDGYGYDGYNGYGGYGGYGDYGGYGGYDYDYDGGYDLGGVYRDDLGARNDLGYYDNAYDQDLYGTYYPTDNDYYGAYGSLMDYDEQLRLAEDISEEERLARWNERLAFEELAEDERERRFQLMSESQRCRLGLFNDSWWGSRYRGSPLGGNWRSRYGSRLGAWSSSRLPLSSSLTSRFGRIWGGNSVRRALKREVGQDRLYALQQRLTYAQERANMDALAQSERLRMQMEAERLQEELRRIQLQSELEEERARSDLRRQELYREAELREDIIQLNEEQRLRQQIADVGRGYY